MQVEIIHFGSQKNVINGNDDDDKSTNKRNSVTSVYDNSGWLG